MLTRTVSRIGSSTIDMISGFGAAMILLWKVIKNVRFIHKDFHLYAVQAHEIGVASLPLVILIGTFTGMVSTWQANYSFGSMMPEQYLGVATFKAVIIELGPVLSGLVLAGRVGSSLAAELGTMRVSEQIDAFNVLAIDPIRYLIAPRFMASLFMVPILVTLAVFMSLWGGFIVANLFMDMGIQTYFGEIPVFFKMQDVRVMLIKATTFGAIIGLVGTYVGINTTGGAEGVGQSTIKAFVLSALMILFGDYFLATLLF